MRERPVIGYGLRVLILTLLVSLAPAAYGGGGAVAFVPEPDYDFGKIISNHTYEHSFDVVNTGTETLEITKVVVG